jgi:hypothetical protein
MQKEETAGQLAARTLNESLASIDTSGPGYVRELVGAFRANVTEALQAGAQLESDRAELTAKADLIPAAGAARLAREAEAEAKERAKSALNNARSAAATLRRAALLEVQPQVKPEREALSRGELEMLIGEGTPDQLSLRIANIAASGSRDALGALNSDYGRALLRSRGMEGRDLDEALTSARRVIAETALENPGRHSEKELAAARLYRSTGELANAVAASSFYLGHIGLGAL